MRIAFTTILLLILLVNVSFAQLVIPLTEGENLISINVIPPQEFFRENEQRGPDVVLMFEQIQDQIVQVQAHNGHFYIPVWGFNSIGFWDLAQAYVVRVNEDVDYVIDGDPIPFDTDIQLREGENWIAYFPDFELDASAPDFYVLSPIIDVVVSAADWQGNIMIPEENFSNMDPWHEGKGYVVTVTEDVVLNYPNNPELRWLALPDTSFAEDESLQLSLEYFYEHISSPGFPIEDLAISVVDGEQLFSEVNDDELTITAEEDWNGIDSLMLIVTDPDENSDSTYQRITVTPVNDPPTAFDLAEPDDEAVFSCRDEVVFKWERSFDPDPDDDVNYNLKLLWWDEISPESPIDSFLFETADTSFAVIFEEIGIEGGCIPQYIGWCVFAISDEDTTESLSHRRIEILDGYADRADLISNEFRLYPPSPNPFNSTTTISFALPQRSDINITAWDIHGRMVDQIFASQESAGHHSVFWKPVNKPSGIYILKIYINNKQLLRKVLLVR